MVKVYILLCVLLYSTVSGQKFRSDYKYFDRLGGWLKYQLVPATWNDARLRCHVEGGVLASPLNGDLMSIMISIMKDKEVPMIYTGIHSTYSKGDYSSIEGVTLQDMPTLQGKLIIDNKNNEEECLIVSRSGTLNDVKCKNVYPYICYKAYDPQMAEPNECGTVDKGYIFSEVTGHCYKFHSYGQPWDRAYMTCAAEGGHLAIINSEKEADVLREIFNQHPKITTIGAYWVNLGYRTDRENNFWFTIDGHSLKDAGYETWRPGEPNNHTSPGYESGQPCGSIALNGLLDDNHCALPTVYICEKHPDSLR